MMIRVRLGMLLPIIRLDLNLKTKVKGRKGGGRAEAVERSSMNLHYVTHYVHYLAHLIAPH